MCIYFHKKKKKEKRHDITKVPQYEPHKQVTWLTSHSCPLDITGSPTSIAYKEKEGFLTDNVETLGTTLLEQDLFYREVPLFP